MIHIVFFAPYPEIRGVIEEVFSQRHDKEGITYEIMPDHFNNTLEHGVHGDVIISRGFTADTLKKTDIPSVELTTSGYDVIMAVDKCLRNHTCKKVAVVGAFNMVYGSECIGAVYGSVEIASYTVEKEIHLQWLVEKAISEGADAIVGGHSTVNIAREYGIPAVLIESGKEAINSAISNAVQTVAITRRERRKSSEIAGILNYSFEGIISTDAEGTITLANQRSASLLSKGEGLLGRSLSDFFPDLDLGRVIGQGEMLLSQIHRIRGSLMLVNCVPISGKRENAGSVVTFQDVTKIQKQEEKIRQKIHGKGFVAKYTFEDILCRDALMKETVRIARRYADSGSNLLIFGETGTGKELFAQSVHNASRRRNGPFVALNCAALPEHLLESELFGYVEGAFTGAAKGGKPGLFELAHNGTIFLDEIGEIPIPLQAKLLRVLQEREIIRLGGDRVIPIDVRVISASNKSLQDMAEQGGFRQDLLYRLDVLGLTVPPLRRRREDIACLIEHYIALEREKCGCPLRGVDSAGLQLAMSLSWRGNVRELCNFCERLCVLCEKEYAGAEDVRAALDLEDPVRQAGGGPSRMAAGGRSVTLENAERELILSALALHGGARKQTAAYLRMDTSTLWRKMKRYDIS